MLVTALLYTVTLLCFIRSFFFPLRNSNAIPRQFQSDMLGLCPVALLDTALLVADDMGYQGNCLWTFFTLLFECKCIKGHF